MGEGERFSPPPVGGVSLLVVFAVLCLTIFALLSLTTVQADVRLADASAQAVEDYYAADLEAQRVFACLRMDAGVPVNVELTEGEGAEGSMVARYAVPLSDTQALQVELAYQADAGWTVLRWQAAPLGEWESDETIELWDFELF